MLGNAPLVWSHAELARALYVLDAAQLRATWGAAGLWAWRLYRYLALRHQQARHRALTAARQRQQEEIMETRSQPAGAPAATIRPASGGIGRSSSPAAEAVSDALRRGTGNFLTQRRRIALLQTGAAATLSVVGLYQFGLLPSVPEPPLPWLDADRVDASGEAYALFHMPDSSLGITSAGMSLALVGMGGAIALSTAAVDPPRPAGQERARCRGGPLPHCGAADEAQAGLLMVRRDRSAVGRHRAGRRAGGARRLA